MSPVVTINKITRPEHLVEYMHQKISGNPLLGFKYIAKYNDDLLPKYPACLILAGPYTKEIHGLHTFAVMIRAEIFIFHGVLTQDKSTRSYEDLNLATNLVAFLESDMKLGDR